MLTRCGVSTNPVLSAYHEQLSLYSLSQYIILSIEESRDLCDFQFLANPDSVEDSLTLWEETIGAGRQERYRQLEWIAGRLEYIGELGLRQGSIYAGLLRRKMEAHFASRDIGEIMQPWKYCRNVQERTLKRLSDNPETLGIWSINMPKMDAETTNTGVLSLFK